MNPASDSCSVDESVPSTTRSFKDKKDRSSSRSKRVGKVANRIGGDIVKRQLRTKVSQDRVRWTDKDEKLDLDLSYISSNIIAMAFPGSGLEATFRNDINEVSRLLKKYHDQSYMIFNLSGKSYDYSKFDHQVLEFPFQDHHSPPLNLLMKILYSMDNWLSLDRKNVCAIHCKGGKGRTGTVIACYLMYKGIFDTADEALRFFGMMRSNIHKGVTQVAQRRYVNYFHAILRNRVIPKPRALIIKEIKFSSPPRFTKRGCRPLFRVYNSSSYPRQLTYSSYDFISDECTRKERLGSHRPLPNDPVFYEAGPKNGMDKPMMLVWQPRNCYVMGDTMIKFYHLKKLKKKKLKKELMFRFAFHTTFLPTEHGAQEDTEVGLDANKLPPEIGEAYRLALERKKETEDVKGDGPTFVVTLSWEDLDFPRNVQKSFVESLTEERFVISLKMAEASLQEYELNMNSLLFPSAGDEVHAGNEKDMEKLYEHIFSQMKFPEQPTGAVKVDRTWAKKAAAIGGSERPPPWIPPRVDPPEHSTSPRRPSSKQQSWREVRRTSLSPRSRTSDRILGRDRYSVSTWQQGSPIRENRPRTKTIGSSTAWDQSSSIITDMMEKDRSYSLQWRSADRTNGRAWELALPYPSRRTRPLSHRVGVWRPSVHRGEEGVGFLSARMHSRTKSDSSVRKRTLFSDDSVVDGPKEDEDLSKNEI